MAKTPKPTTFALVKLIKQKLLDPYNGGEGLVSVGGTMIVDSDQADFLVGDGMVEILEEGVDPPWVVKPTAKPAVAPVKSSA